jgi:hypothetical protein
MSCLSFFLGFHSQISRLPFDNLGVAVPTNDDLYGRYIIEVIKGRILDTVFGLEPVDWSSRYTISLLVIRSMLTDRCWQVQSAALDSPHASDSPASKGDASPCQPHRLGQNV